MDQVYRKDGVYSSLGLFATEHGEQESHAHDHAVTRFFKVHCAAVAVYLRGDLVNTRQGMEHEHVLGRARQERRVDDVAALHLFVLLFSGKSLLLHASHVQNVGGLQHALEVLSFGDLCASVLQHCDVFAGHLQRRRRDQVELDAVVCHQRCHRVHGASVLGGKH
jgi:hypothetical protein